MEAYIAWTQALSTRSDSKFGLLVSFSFRGTIVRLPSISGTSSAPAGSESVLNHDLVLGGG